MKRIMVLALILFCSVVLYAQHLPLHPLTGVWKAVSLNDSDWSGVIEIKEAEKKFVYTYEFRGKPRSVEHRFEAYVSIDNPTKFLNIFELYAPLMNPTKYVFRKINNNNFIILSDDERFYLSLERVK